MSNRARSPKLPRYARWPCGVYTHYLLEGLRGGARANANDRVSALNLHEFVSNRVTRWCKANKKVVQTPWFKADTPRDIDLGPWGRTLERSRDQIKIKELLEGEAYEEAAALLAMYKEDFGPDTFTIEADGQIRDGRNHLLQKERIQEEIRSRTGGSPLAELEEYKKQYGEDEFYRETRSELERIRREAQSTVILIGQVQRRGGVVPLPQLESPILTRLRQRHPALKFRSASFLDPDIERLVAKAAYLQDFKGLADAMYARCRFVIIVNARATYLGDAPNALAPGVVLQKYHINIDSAFLDVETESTHTVPSTGNHNIAAARATDMTADEALLGRLQRADGKVLRRIVDEFQSWISSRSRE